MAVKRHLFVLLVFLGHLRLFSTAAINIFPFTTEKRDPISPDNNNNNNNHNNNHCPIRAIRNRFHSYTEIDFNERAQQFLKRRLDSTVYGSFYEFLRQVVLSGGAVDVAKLKEVLETGELVIPALKHWLMLDKLMNDSTPIYDAYALNDYAEFVVFKQNSEGVFTHANKLELFKAAIKTHKPPGLLKLLIEAFGKSISAPQGKFIISLICEYLLVGSQDWEQLPVNFGVLQVALLHINPNEFFALIDFEDQNIPLWIRLLPFYYLFMHADRPEQVKEARAVLEDVSLDFDRDTLVLLEKFVKLTDFCTVFPDNLKFTGRSEIFQFVLKRLAPGDNNEIETQHDNKTDRGINVEFTNQLVLVVIDLKFTYFLEALLMYDPACLQDTRMQETILRLGIKNNSPLIVIMICIYRSISAQELVAIHRSAQRPTNHILVVSIQSLFDVIEDFDVELEDCHEEAHLNDEGVMMHPLPQPRSYESIARKYLGKNVNLDINWIVRILLTRYFGISLNSSAIGRDFECNWIWKEIAGAINLFLFLKGKNSTLQHQVSYQEP